MIGALMLAAAVALGCGGTAMDQQLPPRRDRSLGRAIDTLGFEGVVAAPAARVWQVLPSVFADLGLEINFREPGPKRVGTCYQQVRGRLGRELLSAFIDCGDDRSMPNADRFDVALTVLTTVVPVADSSTKVVTFVLGVGANPTVSGNRVWCYSKGALEERIRRMTEERTRS